MGFILTLVTLMALGDLAWWWKAHRLLNSVPHRRWWRTGLAAFLIVQLAGLSIVFFSRAPEWQWASLTSRPLLSAVFIWHLVVLPAVLGAWVVAAVFQASAWMVQRLLRQTLSKPRRDPPHPQGITRRAVLRTGIAAAPALLTVGATAAALPQLQQFRIRRLDATIPGLPDALEGLTIAHVSDLHVGRFTNGRVLADIVDAVNALSADLVLHTGDLINHALSDLPAAIDIVNAMRGRLGSFMCEGNHDLIENPRLFRSRALAGGLPLLINESQRLSVRGQQVEILGLRWGGVPGSTTQGDRRFDGAVAGSMAELLAQRHSGAFPIVLAHHPHAFDHAEDVPLMLSGHTHGGQLMATPNAGFGPLFFRYWSGLYAKNGRVLCVSNGVGNWFPLRTRAPAEIIHLTLRQGGAAETAR